MNKVLLCLAGVAMNLPTAVAVGPIPEAVKPLPEAAKTLKAYYTALQSLPGLLVRYRIDREKLDPAIKHGWGWEWCEVENGITPGRTDKARVRFKGPDTGADGRSCVRGKDLALDGQLFARLEDSDEKGRAYPAVVAISTTKRHSPAELNAHFNYFRYLGYGVMDDPDKNMSSRMVYPKTDYWMPAALVTHADQYEAHGEQELKGVTYQVLRRDGWDEWLIEPGPPVHPRRRVFRWSKDGPIREVVVYNDFRPTGKGIDLPWKIVYTSYAAPQDGPRFAGKPSRRLTLTVKEIRTDPLPDSYFRPDIPPGSLVDDLAGGGGHPRSFIHKPTGDPFAKAVEAIEKARPARRFPWLVLLLLASVVAVAAAVVWRWRALAHPDSTP